MLVCLAIAACQVPIKQGGCRHIQAGRAVPWGFACNLHASVVVRLYDGRDPYLLFHAAACVVAVRSIDH